MSLDATRAGLSRYAYRGRHRTPETTTTAVRSAALGAGVVAAVMVGSAAPATAAPSDDPWHRLRMCESGGNYSINTGNGYYGAYQFNLGTWRAYGGTGLPSDASPAEQDRIARNLYRARGWSPWPGCSRKLGLRESAAHGVAAPVRRAVTIKAPGTLARGRAMTVTGTANAGATVRVYLRYAAESRYRLIRTLRADDGGEWATRVRPRGTGQYYAVSGARRSARVATHVVVPTTISAPATVRVGSPYVIRGTAKPGTKVVVRLGTDGAGAYAKAYRRPVDRAGRWSMVWRGTTDYRFYAVGQTVSPVAVTRVRTTTFAVRPATERLSTARPVVTVTGTARPRAEVVLYVRTPGRDYRVFRKVVASGAGRYATRFRAPADTFTWYARGSNGTYSVIGKVST